MRKSISIARGLMGLGLVSALFLGCQQFLGQEEAAKKEGVQVESGVASEVALQLSIKETSECQALRDQVLAADAAGEATVTLQTDFIRNCIVEVKSSDPVKVPIIDPALIVDAKSRCRWIISEIEGGRKDLIIKLHYWCPDECDTLKVIDSVRHVRICKDPAPDCAALKAKLALLDPKSGEYARLRLFLSQHCGTHDTILPPKDPILTDCEILRKKLSGMDTTGAEFQRLLHAYHGKCVLPPKDTVIVRPTLCDSLRKQLAALDPASEAYAKMKRYYTEKCLTPVDTIVKPLPIHCDSLKRLLAAADPVSEAYARLKRLIAEKCVEIKPVDPVKPPIDSAACEHMLAKLKSLDPASHDYAVLKHAWYSQCVEVKPADPIKPVQPVMDCEAIRLKMSHVDPASADYAYLKNLLAEKCGIK